MNGHLKLVTPRNDIVVTYKCMACGYTSDDDVSVCPHCGAMQTLAPEEESSETKQVQTKRRKAKPASEIASRLYKPIPTGRKAWDEALGGGLVQPSTILVHGPKGTRKTTTMLDVCTKVARKLGGMALYGTSEMSGELIRHYADRNQVNLKRLIVSDAGDCENMLADIEEFEPVIVVWDSVQAFTWEGSTGETELRNVMRAAIRSSSSYQHISILVSQVTKDHDFLGPSELGHNVDVIVELKKKNGKLYIECPEKNRFAITPLVGEEDCSDQAPSSPRSASARVPKP